MTSRFRFILFALIVLSAYVGIPKPRCLAQPVTAAAVNEAIDRAVDFLRTSQVARTGKWPGHEDYGCGQSALVLLALLNAGLPPDDRTLESGLDFLKRTKPSKTYEVALQTMVFRQPTLKNMPSRFNETLNGSKKPNPRAAKTKEAGGMMSFVVEPTLPMLNSVSWPFGKRNEHSWSDRKMP